MSPQETLDELNRIHDDEPERAAAGLLALDPAGLDEGALRTYAFLLNHVLGEKLGRWSEALDRLAPLARRDDAPVAGAAAMRRRCPVRWRCGRSRRGDRPARCAGRRRCCARPQPGEAGGARLHACGRRRCARAGRHAAAQACAAAPSPLDASFAATFNNVTTALYYATREAPLTAPLRGALRRGAEAALLFWLRAGAGWSTSAPTTCARRSRCAPANRCRRSVTRNAGWRSSPPTATTRSRSASCCSCSPPGWSGPATPRGHRRFGPRSARWRPRSTTTCAACWHRTPASSRVEKRCRDWRSSAAATWRPP
jgi:hypothetical protein